MDWGSIVIGAGLGAFISALGHAKGNMSLWRIIIGLIPGKWRPAQDVVDALDPPVVEIKPPSYQTVKERAEGLTHHFRSRWDVLKKTMKADQLRVRCDPCDLPLLMRAPDLLVDNKLFGIIEVVVIECECTDLVNAEDREVEKAPVLGACRHDDAHIRVGKGINGADKG